MTRRKISEKQLGRPRRKTESTNARARLLKAAARLFAARGYAATPVAAIVGAAGVTKPVLYYHFQNKEGLFRGLMDEASLQLGETVLRNEESGGAARARIRAFYADLFDLFVANLEIARFMDVVMYGPPEAAPDIDLERIHELVRAVVRRLVRDGLRRGEFRRGREDDILWGLLGILRITTETYLHHPDHSPGRAGMLRLLDLFLDGLSTGRAAKGKNDD